MGTGVLLEVTRRFGYIRDPRDARDRKLDDLLSAGRDLPTRHSLRHFAPEVYDQGPTSSCVAQAVAMGLRVERASNGGVIAPPSRLYLYHAARSYSGMAQLDRGSHIRAAVTALQKLGCPDEDAWPFEPRNVLLRPSWAAHRAAHDRHGLRGYYRCGDLSDIRRAIAADRPVVAGWTVTSDFLDAEGPRRISSFEGTVAGGHAMLVVGYDDAERSLELVNSWGEDWRDGGFCRLSYALAEQHKDAWAIDCTGPR